MTNLEQQRILVVDDERVIADTIGAILRKAGFTVDVAYNGLAAMESARCNRPTLVLSDVVMPGMDGVEMAILLRREQPDCRILLFSGQAATANLLRKARLLGHNFHIIAKPVHPQELIRYIRETVQTAPATEHTGPAVAS